MIRVVKKKIVGEAEGRPGGCALATSGQQGTKGLFLAPGTTGAGPKLPEGWEESPETGHQNQQLEAPDCQPGACKGSAQSESEAVHDKSPHPSLPTSQPEDVMRKLKPRARSPPPA